MVPGGIVLLDSLRLPSIWRWPIVGLDHGMGGFFAGVQGFSLFSDTTNKRTHSLLTIFGK